MRPCHDAHPGLGSLCLRPDGHVLEHEDSEGRRWGQGGGLSRTDRRLRQVEEALLAHQHQEACKGGCPYPSALHALATAARDMRHMRRSLDALRQREAAHAG